MNAIEPEELIKPAVEGTLSVLKAAAAHGPGVKRIVVLSSTAAVVSVVPAGTPRDARSWHEGAPVEWWGERKASLPWDLIALNPPFVFGPFLHEVQRPEDLNTSAAMWYNTIVKGQLSNDALATQG